MSEIAKQARPLILPGVTPSNLKLPERFKVIPLESDMYNICDRIKEISPNLFIELLVDEKTGAQAWVIQENTINGPKEVFKTEELDGRVIEHCQYLLKVPFEKRFAEAERLARKDMADYETKQMDKLMERLAGPFLRQLYHDGFVHGAKPNANLPYKRKKQ